VVELAGDLVRRLKRRKVSVDTPDTDTLLLANVPPNERCFNKRRTNVLVKRPQPGMPFVVCVDDDLCYTGDDEVVARAFAGGPTLRGWRVLVLGTRPPADPGRAVEHALDALGFDGVEPSLRRDEPAPKDPPSEGKLLASAGEDLTALARAGADQITVGRYEALHTVLASLRQRQLHLPLVAGPSGVGKTNLLYAVARALAASDPPTRLVRVDVACLMAGTLFPAERDNLLSTLLREAREARDTVVALENLNVAVTEAPQGLALLVQAIDAGARLVGTVLTPMPKALGAPPLRRRLVLVPLDPFDAPRALDVLIRLGGAVAAHHEVGISVEMARLVVERAATLEGWLPGKAVALLDAAAARAKLAGARSVTDLDIHAAATGFIEITGG
jgi:ATP-dependent Clp protease ATP-binding subunit ClpA